MTHKTNTLLERVVLVKVEANIYGARKKLKKEDLVLADGSRLPPDDLASLGSKRLLDPDKLSVFNRLKKEAERICLRVGTRFMGGFAIPVETATSITEGLERIAHDFAVAKGDFLAGYESAVKDWVIRHPEFAVIIEQAVDSVEYVSTRLSFDYLVVTIGLPEQLPEKDLARLEQKVGSLSGQMFYEISVEANQLIEQSLLGKDQVTRNALRPIRRIRDKLDGLSFLDYRVAPVVGTIDQLLSRIPNKGAIEGSLLQEILATALLLADPDKTRRHGEGLLAANAELMVETNSNEQSIVEKINDDAVLAIPTTEPEFSALGHSPTGQSPIIESEQPAQAQNDYADLFAGIFDDELELQEVEEDWAIDGLIKEPAIEEMATDVGFAAALPIPEKTNPPVTESDYWF